MSFCPTTFPELSKTRFSLVTMLKLAVVTLIGYISSKQFSKMLGGGGEKWEWG